MELTAGSDPYQAIEPTEKTAPPFRYLRSTIWDVKVETWTMSSQPSPTAFRAWVTIT